jgi:hypothetical protein
MRRKPVSAADSLLTGKNTGNFFIFYDSAILIVDSASQIQRLAAEFPMNRNREVSRSLQGIMRREQGNLIGDTQWLASGIVATEERM